MFNFENLGTSVSSALGRTGLKFQKYSPEILTGVGVVGVVTAGVMASRATLKLSPILEEKNKDLEKIKEVRSREDADELYPESAANQDTAKVYVRTGIDLFKLYGPALSLGALSIVSIISAQGILKKRNVALAAAYKTIETAFSEYRERVAEELGEEEELNIFRQREEEEIKDEDTGETKKVIREYPGYSPYAKVFGELSEQWSNNPEYNRAFLTAQQNYFNDRLQAKGHVFLNEVYDALDIPRTAAGQFVGWVKGNGDDYIDFGMFDINDPNKVAFLNGYEAGILLDFNVDGQIYDLIG